MGEGVNVVNMKKNV